MREKRRAVLPLRLTAGACGSEDWGVVETCETVLSVLEETSGTFVRVRPDGVITCHLLQEDPLSRVRAFCEAIGGACCSAPSTVKGLVLVADARSEEKGLFPNRWVSLFHPFRLPLQGNVLAVRLSDMPSPSKTEYRS